VFKFVVEARSMARVLAVKNKRDKKKDRRLKKKQRLSLDQQTGKHNKNCKINRWNPDNTQSAIDEYWSSNGTTPVRQLARAWNVPRSTLQMRISGKVFGSGHEVTLLFMLSLNVKKRLLEVSKVNDFCKYLALCRVLDCRLRPISYA
jgi:hypothetical protein